MNRSRPTALDDLRNLLTANQKSILNEIWRYWSEERKLITAIALYTKFGKEIVESSLSDLGGSIVLRSGDAGRKYYQITFLGMLLTNVGPASQQLLEQYLTYLRDRLVSEPELGAITRDEFEADLGFTDEKWKQFRQLLYLSPFWRGGNETMGTIYVPSEVDDLVVSTDIHRFFEQRALKNYIPNKPLDFTLAHDAALSDSTVDHQKLWLTMPKLWVLGLGSYVLYLLYVVSSQASIRAGGLYAFQYRSTWWIALGQTAWFLVAVLAALLLASVMGPERFVGLFPLTRRLALLKPIRTELAEDPTHSDDEPENIQNNGKFSEQTGLGLQLYLDYNESIKRVYNNAILQYRNSFYFSLVFASVGAGVIFYTLVFRNNGNVTWAGAVVSAVIEAVPALFFYLSDKARKQMIDVFVDLRRDNEVARAYELLRTLKNTDKLEALKEEIIRHTILTQRTGDGGSKSRVDHT